MAELLAVDAGQSGVRLRLADGTSWLLPGLRNDGTGGVQLVDRVLEVLDRLPRRTVGAVAVGATGLRSDASAADLLAGLRAHGVRSVWLTHDSVTSYLGALGQQDGAVVAAGTGTIGLGVGPLGLQRVDGWGYLLGNGGSGYWIGREGLAAVLRAHDGRGPATRLTERVRARVADLETLYLELADAPDRVARIAGWAPVVAEEARADPVCAEICQRAGAELARTALAALDRVGVTGRRLVAGIGSVLSAAPVAAAFEAALGAADRAAVRVPPRGNGLDGAAQLPQLGPESALHPRVSIACDRP